MSFARIFTFSTEFDSQTDLKNALDDGTVDAIVVYYCGSQFNQDEYYAVRTIHFPTHWFGVGAFLNADGENEQIRNDEDEDLFRCLKKKTQKSFKNVARGKLPKRRKRPCRQTFREAQGKSANSKEGWMFVVIGSAAILVFLLGVGAIYSWQFQTATANVHGEPPSGGSRMRRSNATKRPLFSFPNARTHARIA